MLCFVLTYRWGVYYWDTPVTTAGLRAAGRIMLAALLLWIVGSALLFRFVWSHEECDRTSRKLEDPVGLHVVALVVGQVVCQLWILLRAFLSGVSFNLFGTQLPITSIEVAATLVLILTSAVRKFRSDLGPRIDLSKIAMQALYVGGFILLLSVAFVPLVIRELPRNIALSSDPDQHAFWASQVLRLGGIPWDQGLLGIGSFGYPAGFAALNALWCGFSGLSPVEIVTVQPQIQFFLAMLLIAALSARLVTSAKWLRAVMSPRNTGWETLLVGGGMCCVYWYLLPYGLQHAYYHNAGAARSAASLLSVIPLLGWVAFPSRADSRIARVALLATMTLAVVLVATLNPIIVLYPAIVLGAMIAHELGITLVAARKRRIYASALPLFFVFAIAGLVLLLGDPYFGEVPLHLVSSGAGGGARGTSNATQGVGLSWSMPNENLSDWIGWRKIISHLCGDALQPGAMTGKIALVIGGSIALWWACTRGSASRYICALIFLSVSYYGSLGLPISGTLQTPSYLIRPYLERSFSQNGTLLGFIGLAALLRLLLCAVSSRGLLLMPMVCGVLVWQVHVPAVAHNPAFNMTPRVNYCGSMGCANSSDLKVLEFVRGFGEGILSKYPELTYESAPKILILGNIATLGVEKWVFPLGASRILPLTSVLPVAFFYGRGSPDWSYDNYRKRVCLRFDKAWLQGKNVRYLFIPSGGVGCLRDRKKVFSEATILFEDGDARFLQLL